MKKILILLLAALMIVGLGVSCKPDPEPDAFKGTWVGTDDQGNEYKLVCDGFGNVTYTFTEDGEDPVTYSNSHYALDTTNGYVTMTYEDEQDPLTLYVYIDEDAEKYYIHTDIEDKAIVFPTDYEDDEKLLALSKDENEYSGWFSYEAFYLSASYTLNDSTAEFSLTEARYAEDYDEEDPPALLCSFSVTTDFASATESSTNYWDYKVENEAKYVNKYALKAKYTLTSNTLTIYDPAAEELVLTRE